MHVHKMPKHYCSFTNTEGSLLTQFFLDFGKINRVSRKPCKWTSDVVINGQMRAPKYTGLFKENVLLENRVSGGLPVLSSWQILLVRGCVCKES